MKTKEEIEKWIISEWDLKEEDLESSRFFDTGFSLFYFCFSNILLDKLAKFLEVDLIIISNSKYEISFDWSHDVKYRK